MAGLGGAEDERCCEFGGKLSVFLESSAELIQDPEAMMEKAGPGSTLLTSRYDMDLMHSIAISNLVWKP